MLVQVAFVTGVTLCMFLPTLPAWWVGALPLLSFCFLSYFIIILRPFILFLCSASLGLGYAGWRANWRLVDELSPALENKKVRVIGVVRGLSPTPKQRGSFLLEVEQALVTADKHVSSRIRVADPMRRAWPSGSRWEFKLTLHSRHAPANPYGYDAEQWMWASAVLATGSAGAQRQRLNDASDATAWLDKLRDAMVQRVRSVLGPTREAALVAALAVGAQQNIKPQDWERFSQTGLNHLVAISGLHVGIIAAMAAWLTRQCLQRWHKQCLVPPQVLVAIVTMLVAASYALLAGFAVPTRRALFMLASAALMLTWRRVFSPFQVLWTALAVLLLLDPFAVLTPGLWLSFGLVAALMTVAVGRRTSARAWRAAIAAHWGTTVASIVPLGLFFGALPLASPLANALAIPYVSLVVTPLALLGVLLPLDWVLQLAAAAARYFLVVLDLFRESPLVYIARPPWIVSLGALLGTAWLIMPRGFPGRLSAVLLLFPFLLYRPPAPPVGGFRMTVFDVGQGLSVLIQTAHRALLYDTGALAANAVVLPQLHGMGIRGLDKLVLSHHDIDHDGAAPDIVNAMPVATVLAGQAETWHQRRLPAEQCTPGLQWVWDGVRFEVLSPTSPYGVSKNACSCVVRVVGYRHSVLLTGDIPASVESQLVRETGAGLKSDVMLAPHHGGKTSSSCEFLARVAPGWVIISAGYHNRYGHPNDKVLQRYRSVGTRILRTDLHGAITVDASAELTITRFRETAARYWRPR